MSDHQPGDYPSPTASQSGPYPHRPTADTQLAHQLAQAIDGDHSNDYSRQAHGGAAEAPMQWSTSSGSQQHGLSASEHQQHAIAASEHQHTMAAPANPTQYAQYAPDLTQSQQMTPGQVSVGDDEPSKKKQKTSRACDECRRKKVSPRLSCGNPDP